MGRRMVGCNGLLRLRWFECGARLRWFCSTSLCDAIGTKNWKIHSQRNVRHSRAQHAIGCHRRVLLWLGWFGFNGGSALAADPKAVSYVFVTTSLAACGGAVTAMLVSWALTQKHDVTMALNGILAGLVGITAGADTVGEGSSILIGAIAGALVVVSIMLFDKIRIDDPVGAISVHGVCGIWGTVAVGFFSFDPAHNPVTQLIGTLSIGAFAFIFSLIVFGALKLIFGIRVSAEEETIGLDISEHGMHAYPHDAVSPATEPVVASRLVR